MGHGGTESEYLGRQAQEPTVSAVVLMHTKILELLSYRASEELCLDIRICKGQVLKSTDAPDPSPQKS